MGWKCDNVRAAYSEISQDIQNEVYAGARAFVQANKGRYKCGGYIYTGEGQDLGQFWAELNVGNAKVKKTTANEIVTNGNAMYSIVGATFGIFLDQNCSNQIGTLTTNENGDTNEVEVTAGTVYIKELSAPKGYKLDTTARSLKVEAGKTAVLNVSDVPKVTERLVDLFKIDMETGKATAQGNAALSGAEFTWHYYDGFYTKDNLPEKAIRTWVTKTVAEKSSDGSIRYVTKMSDAYKVSGDAFYIQNEKSVLPLGTLTVEETKAPDGYLLDGAYMQAGDSTEQIKGMYLTQITEDGELAVLSGSNQYSVSDQVIRGGVKIQKRDLETKDTKAQGSATLKDTAFAIISLNENSVLVEGKLYKKNETVKTIQTGIDGIATTTTDLLPYGKYKLEETKAPEGYLTDGAKAIEFSITENGKIVDLTDESHSIYNQIKRGDLEGVKIGAGTHKRLANVPFKITSKTTGESHIVVTDKNGKKEIEAGKDLTIVDTVTLEGLEIGTKYKLSGWQMIKEENAKLIIDGKEVTNDYEFTADKENMEVQIEFTFDGSTLGRKQLVTFEELYDITNLEEPKKVTEHKEINDEGQTVTIKEVPETPTPETPGTTTKTSNPPKTGDTANTILWIAILVLSAAGIIGVRIWNKKKQVKRLGIEEKKEEEE